MRVEEHLRPADPGARLRRQGALLRVVHHRRVARVLRGELPERLLLHIGRLAKVRLARWLLVLLMREAVLVMRGMLLLVLLWLLLVLVLLAEVVCLLRGSRVVLSGRDVFACRATPTRVAPEQAGERLVGVNCRRGRGSAVVPCRA